MSLHDPGMIGNSFRSFLLLVYLLFVYLLFVQRVCTYVNSPE